MLEVLRITIFSCTCILYLYNIIVCIWIKLMHTFLLWCVLPLCKGWYQVTQQIPSGEIIKTETSDQSPSWVTRDTGPLNRTGQFRHSWYLCERVSLERGQMGGSLACRNCLSAPLAVCVRLIVQGKCPLELRDLHYFSCRREFLSSTSLLGLSLLRLCLKCR